MPRLKRYLAHLLEGPVIDWGTADLERWLEPMLGYLKARLRCGWGRPCGPALECRGGQGCDRRPGARRLGTWRPPCTARGRRHRRGCAGRAGGTALGEDGFAGQPRYVPGTARRRSLEQAQNGFNQGGAATSEVREGRRQSRPGRPGGPPGLLRALRRDRRTDRKGSSRALTYFQRMWTALFDGRGPGLHALYLAHHDGEVLAGATMLTVGEHVWYSYGASTSRWREVFNNALQWRMMCDAQNSARPSTISAHHRHPGRGRIWPAGAAARFKAGAGGEAVEYLGEWTTRSTSCCTRPWACTWHGALESSRTRPDRPDRIGAAPTGMARTGRSVGGASPRPCMWPSLSWVNGFRVHLPPVAQLQSGEPAIRSSSKATRTGRVVLALGRPSTRVT
ncbi:GNAT family N-acetyltransferase [Streptomyces thinghirensis]|nr:GNAT family N-acetyltransferase [Streptomyces thinghirensis]